MNAATGEQKYLLDQAEKAIDAAKAIKNRILAEVASSGKTVPRASYDALLSTANRYKSELEKARNELACEREVFEKMVKTRWDAVYDDLSKSRLEDLKAIERLKKDLEAAKLLNADKDHRLVDWQASYDCLKKELDIYRARLDESRQRVTELSAEVEAVKDVAKSSREGELRLHVQRVYEKAVRFIEENK